MVDLGYIDEKTLFKGLEYLFHVPYVDLTDTVIDKDAVGMIPETLAKKHTIIPIKKENSLLTVATSDPLNFYAMDDVKNVSGMEVTVVITPQKDIINAIDRYYGSEIAEKAFEDLKKEYGNLNLAGLSELSESEVANAPVVRLINSILQHALKSNASDIHIEPTATKLKVHPHRRRTPGGHDLIHDCPPSGYYPYQDHGPDGHTRKSGSPGRPCGTDLDGKSVDLRISLLPTVYGEKIVIRILGGSTGAMTKEQLGLSEKTQSFLTRSLKVPRDHSLSGPTGSGKTTTLYSVLKEINKPNVNIITVEDPVEYKLDGINQVQVNVKAGLTFANGLRSILRQDPDIIMIGEIRDGETARSLSVLPLPDIWFCLRSIPTIRPPPSPGWWTWELSRIWFRLHWLG